MSSLIQKIEKTRTCQIGNWLVGTSKRINFALHGKDYMMFCTSVYLITHGGEHRGWIRSSVFFRFISRYGFVDSFINCIVWALYLPVHIFLDVIFFFKSIIVRLFFKKNVPIQFKHCRDCSIDEQHIIPERDWSGTRCIVWRLVFKKFWR